MNQLIKKINFLEFSLDKPMGKYSEIRILERFISYSTTNYKTEKTISSDFSNIDKDKLSVLINDLNTLNLKKWKKSYISYKIPNPITWSLLIRYNDNKNIKEYFGSNEFPIPTVKNSPFHPNSSTSFTPEFLALLKALNKVLDKRTFFK